MTGSGGASMTWANLHSAGEGVRGLVASAPSSSALKSTRSGFGFGSLVADQATQGAEA